MKNKSVLPIVTLTLSVGSLLSISYLFYGYFIKHFTTNDMYELGFFEVLIMRPLLLLLFAFWLILLLWMFRKKEKITKLHSATCIIGILILVVYMGCFYVFKEQVFLLSHGIPVRSVVLSYESDTIGVANNNLVRISATDNNVFYYNKNEMGCVSYSYDYRGFYSNKIDMKHGVMYRDDKYARSFKGSDVIFAITDWSSTVNAITGKYGKEGFIYFGILGSRIDWEKYANVDIDIKYEKMTGDGYVFFVYTDSEDFLNEEYLDQHEYGSWGYIG